MMYFLHIGARGDVGAEDERVEGWIDDDSCLWRSRRWGFDER
jgi:hypothetical protein